MFVASIHHGCLPTRPNVCYAFMGVQCLLPPIMGVCPLYTMLVVSWQLLLTIDDFEYCGCFFFFSDFTDVFAHRSCLTVLAEVIGFLRLWRLFVLRFTVHEDAVGIYGFHELLFTIGTLGRSLWDLWLWRLLGYYRTKTRAVIIDVLQMQQSLVYPCRRCRRAIGDASAMFVAVAGNVMFVTAPRKSAMFVAAFTKLLGTQCLLCHGRYY